MTLKSIYILVLTVAKMLPIGDQRGLMDNSVHFFNQCDNRVLRSFCRSGQKITVRHSRLKNTPMYVIETATQLLILRHLPRPSVAGRETKIDM